MKRLLLLLVCALLITACDRRISEAEFDGLVRDNAGITFDLFYYRGRVGADCYVYHERWMGFDRSYVFETAHPGDFPAIPLSSREADWKRIWTRIDSLGKAHYWIGGDGAPFP